MFFRKRKKSLSSAAISSSRKNNSGRGCLAVFFSAFLLMGLFFMYLVVVDPLRGILAAQSWVATPAQVLSSKVATHHGDDGNTYSVEIKYRYTFDGKQYESDRYKFMSGSSSGRSGKQAVVDAHPPGHQFTCYVDPENPASAVIERGFTLDLLFGLIPLVFIVVGGGGVWYAVRYVGKPKEGALSYLPQQKLPTASYPTARDGDEPLVLQSTGSPLARLGCMLFFCLFWNGITSVFVTIAVKSHLDGDPEWFLTFFIIPFVLIGLVCVGAVGVAFFSLFNPRPTLTLSRATVTLGGAAEASWKFSGRTHVLRHLKISLRGEESATYRRGTDTVTDKEQFADFTLVDTNDPLEIASGRVRMSIPDDTMHSLEGDNNKILWTIQVQGDIRLWPNVSETFPLVVRPHPLSDLVNV